MKMLTLYFKYYVVAIIDFQLQPYPAWNHNVLVFVDISWNWPIFTCAGQLCWKTVHNRDTHLIYFAAQIECWDSLRGEWMPLYWWWFTRVALDPWDCRHVSFRNVLFSLLSSVFQWSEVNFSSLQSFCFFAQGVIEHVKMVSPRISWCSLM